MENNVCSPVNSENPGLRSINRTITKCINFQLSEPEEQPQPTPDGKEPPNHSNLHNESYMSEAKTC